MNDKLLMVASVAIALVVWFYVFSNEHREATFQIPVYITEERDGTLAFIEPNEVTVRVTGPQALIAQAMTSNTAVDINVSDRPAERSTIRLSPLDIKMTGLEVVAVNPSQILLDLRPTVKKQLTVQPSILGLPAEGYKISSVISTPEKLTIEGVADTLRALSNIQTENISVAGLNETMVFGTATVVQRGVKSSMPVEVQVVIEEDIISKDMVNTRLACREGTNASVILPVVTVTVEGRRDMLNAIPADTVFAEVDCSFTTPTIVPRQFTNFKITKLVPDHIGAVGVGE